PRLKERLDRGQTRFEQQSILIHWFFEQFSRYLPREKVVRYEDTITTRGKNLAAVVPAAEALDRPLSSRNSSNDYDKTVLLEAGETLLRTDGAAWEFYTRAEAQALLDDLTMGGFSPAGVEIDAQPTRIGLNGQAYRGNAQQVVQPPRRPAPAKSAPMPSVPGAPTLADLPLDLPGAPARKAVTQSGGGKRRKSR
ncbi:MAG: hypothetical protein ACR2J8_13205, partial [Thermomicrobiales bacterium]